MKSAIESELGAPAPGTSRQIRESVVAKIAGRRILLVGNYPADNLWSMTTFSRVLAEGLVDGNDVRLIHPKPYFGRVRWPGRAVRKWLGYIDKYIVFPFELLRQARWADVIHICDQANAPYVQWIKSRPHIVTCHDTIAIRASQASFPEYPLRFTGRLYQRWILSGLRRSKRIVCVSPTTAMDLIALGGIRKDRVGTVDNGMNFPYSPMDESEAWQRLQEKGISRGTDFFLHVGGNDWYKNRKGVVRVFAELRRRPRAEKSVLILAGQPLAPDIRELASSLGLETEVRNLPNVSSEELRALYSVARALIFPSLQEGFGWPVIEAQACGCPVFCSNRGSLPYVGGSAATYFDPEDIAGAADIIAAGESRNSEQRELGFKNCRRFPLQSMLLGYREQYACAIAMDCHERPDH